MSLKSFGLSDYESRIYEALLSIGRSDARAISKESKVPPTAVYPNLRSLEKKGFVLVFKGENFLFEAVPIRKALDSFEEMQVQRLKSDKEKTISELEKRRPDHEEFDPITLSYGKDVSISTFEELSVKAKKRVYVVGWTFKKARSVSALLKQVKSMVQRNVDVRIIFSEHGEFQDDLAGELTKSGAKIRFYNIGNFSIIIFDDKICKISLKSRDRKERINILIEDRDLSNSMTEYFNVIWKKAKN